MDHTAIHNTSLWADFPARGAAEPALTLAQWTAAWLPAAALALSLFAHQAALPGIRSTLEAAWTHGF